MYRQSMNARQIIYIDTSILISPIIDSGDKKQSANKMIYHLNIHPHEYDVRIPQIVIGEAIKAIIEKTHSNALETHIKELIEIIHKINGDLKPLTTDMVKKALGPREEDANIFL